MDFSYSLDKIKLCGKIIRSKHKWIPNFSWVHCWAEYLSYHSDIEIKDVQTSFAPFRYKYAYVLQRRGEKDGSFFIAEGYNGDLKETRPSPDRFQVEYNPNKSGAYIWQKFCDSFIFYLTDIKSIDIAYDIPDTSINDVFLDTKCDVMTYGKSFNSTYYISPKQRESGRVKIYQKDIENASFKENTLRIECTLKGSWLSFPPYNDDKSREELMRCVEHLNAVKVRKYSFDTNDWKLYALSLLSQKELTSVLGKMSFNTRTKYFKELSPSYDFLNLDALTFITHISNLLKPYERRFRII